MQLFTDRDRRKKSTNKSVATGLQHMKRKTTVKVTEHIIDSLGHHLLLIYGKIWTVTRLTFCLTSHFVFHCRNNTREYQLSFLSQLSAHTCRDCRLPPQNTPALAVVTSSGRGFRLRWLSCQADLASAVPHMCNSTGARPIKARRLGSEWVDLLTSISELTLTANRLTADAHNTSTKNNTAILTLTYSQRLVKILLVCSVYRC